MEVEIFVPCFIDQLNPQIGMNMVKILEKLNCKVHYNANQTCCGQPAFNSGFREEAKAVGKKFLKDFDTEKYIVALSGSCAGYVRNYYGSLFDNTPLHNKSKRVQSKIYEFTEFLTDILKVESLGAKFPAKVTYHDGCGSLRECGIKSQPRKLLDYVDGLELVEMKECETCCGFGGTFSAKFEPISTGMAYTKVHSALDAGAEYIVSADQSCLMQISSYIHQQDLNIKTIHIADVLAEGW